MLSFYINECFVIFWLLLASTSVIRGCKENVTNSKFLFMFLKHHMFPKFFSKMSPFHIKEFFVIFWLLLASTSVMEVYREGFYKIGNIFYVFLHILCFNSFCLKCLLFILNIFCHTLASKGLSLYLSNGGF